MNKQTLWEYFMITLGMGIVSIGMFFFLIPSEIILGSMTGLAMILVNIFPLSLSAMTFMLNMVCLGVGFIFLGKEFGAKTVYASVIYPALLYIFEKVFAQNLLLTQEFVLDAVIGILLLGVGQALLFHVNASSGGLDIIAKIVNKYMHIELGNAVTIIGVLTVMCSVLVYDVRTMVIGFIATYFNGIVINEYIGGFSKKMRVCVISDKSDEIRDYILFEIKRGVTLYEATGGFHYDNKQELITILNKNEYALVMKKIREVDERAFVTVSSVSEVAGYWNR